MAFGVLIGLGVLFGAIWMLTRTLGNTPPYRRLYASKTTPSWREQLNGRDTGASNEAFSAVSSQVIPQLIDAMFHDTNDSHLRMSLVETLNQLPGVYINYTVATGRRVRAAQAIGEFGPAATSAVPALLQALKGNDSFLRGPALEALGEIHADPDFMIPLFTRYLDDDDLRDEAALALANYGSLAKSAVPKILPLLSAGDKDTRVAGARALLKIDPEAYLSATRPPEKASVTNRP